MKRLLRILAAALVFGAVAVWIATGANPGWTKTLVEQRTLDEVTGIEAITYRKTFRPGVEFLLGTAGLAVVMVGASFLFSSKSETNITTKTSLKP